MMHVLDYETCVALLTANPNLAERFMEHAAPEIGVPSVVRSELLLAARVSQRPIENTRLVEHFLEPLVSLPFDEPCAEEYALLRADTPHASLGATDLITLATALANGLSILTVNPRAFAHLPRVKLSVLE